MRKDPEGTAEKTMDELFSRADETSLQEFTQSMYRAYREACKGEKGPAFVYGGGVTYRRIQPRVGRNDPCPCGSGKKYKKCCGR